MGITFISAKKISHIQPTKLILERPSNFSNFIVFCFSFVNVSQNVRLNEKDIDIDEKKDN